jgi:hypothetical protein
MKISIWWLIVWLIADVLAWALMAKVLKGLRDTILARDKKILELELELGRE